MIDALYCGGGVQRQEQFGRRKAKRIAAAEEVPMPRGEKLFRFLAGPMMQRFYGRGTIRLGGGTVTNVETDTRRQWRYQDLPDDFGDDR